MTTTWAPGPATALRAELETLATTSPGRWAFAVRESGHQLASVNGDTVMPAASTIKVALMLFVLRDIAVGRRSLDDVLDVPDVRAGGAGVLNALPSVRRLRLDEVVELMIVVSDNTAANMIIDLLGAPALDKRLAELGTTHTRLQRRLMDLEAAKTGLRNVTTADDQALLLDRLVGPGLLPPELRELALGVLGRQQFNDRMPARLGADVVCRHKTGEITGVRHDVGVLEFDGRQVVLAALGSELDDPASHAERPGPAADIIAEAAATVVRLART
ncbi:serine hydrolase [Phytoactinopolyspora limicola]|uniref:serine hydrolase n=1 Tax=Phytoactinopolyspora limicola TaxID=2715536 RepID=UPI00140A337F|nr:serine hydrolase [Phytoactinopolyspora limicola]